MAFYQDCIDPARLWRPAEVRRQMSGMICSKENGILKFDANVMPRMWKAA
jgi:hypothetical protein